MKSIFSRNISKWMLCAGFVSAMSAMPASASILLAGDDFNSYATGALNGKNGGTGWAGAWVDGGGTNSNVVAAAGDAPMTGNAVRITGNDTAAATRLLSSARSANTIVEFLFQFDAGTITNNDFMALWFGSSTGPNIGFKANCGNGSCVDDIFVRTTGSAGDMAQNIVVGQTYSVLGYLQKTGASTVYNRFDLWVNPTDDERLSLTGSDANFVGASSVSSFNQIGFRTANLSAGEALLIDDLRLSAVPEPGTLALIGLALTGIAGVARRRKA